MVDRPPRKVAPQPQMSVSSRSSPIPPTTTSSAAVSKRSSNSKGENKMLVKHYCLALFLGLTALAFAQNHNVVRWHQIVGVITAPGVDNPVGGIPDGNGGKTNVIHAGAGPWTTRRGSAHVDLSTGEG